MTQLIGHVQPFQSQLSDATNSTLSSSAFDQSSQQLKQKWVEDHLSDIE